MRAAAAAAGLGMLAASCAVPANTLTQQRPLSLRSTIVTADGISLGTVYDENRAQASPSDVPRSVRDAIVAVEDARFYVHGAIDSRALMRAIVANVQEGRAAQGGSTITQQLAKLMFSDPNEPRTWKQKVVEARFAIALENKYTKDQILTMYLNRAYFGARAYGVIAAAETYFAKPLGALSLSDAALLAGMVQAPTKLDPFTNPAGAMKRRAFVLARMRQEHMISRAQEVAAGKQPLRLSKGASSDRFKFPYLVYYAEEEFLRNPAFGKTEDDRANKLFKGGLTITLSVDSHWQQFAEDSVRKALYAPTDPDAALASVDPRTGRLRALVGGRDFKADAFNVAADGARQPGSSFKPFVLGAALESGIAPTARYASWPYTAHYNGIAWPVRNYDGVGHGVVSLRTGMENSINGVYARLGLDVGLDKVIDFAHHAGITAELDRFPALTLGALTYGVSPLQMASAYGTFATNGIHFAPHAIQSVTDPQGTEIYSDRVIAGERTLDESVAYTITDVLRGVACRGTAIRARFGRPIAAKTGTTDEHKDVWLVGYTPDVSTAVWVGYRNPKPMTTLHGIPVYGGTFGAAIWKGYMERALAGSPAESFDPPGVKTPVHQDECDFGHGPGLIEAVKPVVEPRIVPSARPSPSPTPTASTTPAPKPKPSDSAKPTATATPPTTPTPTTSTSP